MAESSLPGSLSHSDEEIRRAVRDQYARAIGGSGGSCCGPARECDVSSRPDLVHLAQYDPAELSSLPADAVVNSFGCGNPLASAGVSAGEIVLDLGSGAGIDVLLASMLVGPTGKVIGLDMTPEMIARARENAARAGLTNVEFRLGEAEHMPVADASVDRIISNCVINLAPDKRKVFAEVNRVLRPGGRVSISDIVTGHLPAAVRNNMALWANCIGGAIEEEEYLGIMREVGLEEVEVVSRQHYDETVVSSMLASSFANGEQGDLIRQFLDQYRDSVGQFWSARITARKPA